MVKNIILKLEENKFFTLKGRKLMIERQLGSGMTWEQFFLNLAKKPVKQSKL